MLELYFNDGNFLPESREEEQSAETVLNIMLAGKTTDTEMCIWPCFYHAPMCKGVLINLDDGTTLRMNPEEKFSHIGMVCAGFIIKAVR